MDKTISKARKREQGQTILLFAFGLVALLAMAALAIDVVTLYVARSEAQRAANAAAIAGAKMFAASGFTSVQGGGSLPLADACAAATAQALAVAEQNTVAGQAAVATVNPPCTVQTSLLNPKITVIVARTGLPTFFARIWNRSVNSISATATAEAYNPSYDTVVPPPQTAPIMVSVKPWLIPNCDSSKVAPANPNCAGSAYFVNPADGSIANNGSFIGNTIVLQRVPNTGIPAVNRYYTLDIPVAPLAQPSALPVCPSTGAPSCGQVGTNDYLDNIACSSQVQFSCGQIIGPGPGNLNVDNTPGFAVGNRTNEGTQCLIHANNAGLGQLQDVITEPGGPGTPAKIVGGNNNPNPALQGVDNISRSDSVVTVPLYDGIQLCAGVNCNVNSIVTGFLQLGITQRVPGPPNGSIAAMILNVAGCNPTPLGNTVSGGGVSPVPVRLINQ